MKSGKCKKNISFFSFTAPFVKAALLCASIFFFSCGLEDYPYINPIRQSSVSQELNTRAVVDLRSYDETISFSNFVIFYRIYVSDTLILSTTREQYSAINSVLASDYNTIHPYIDSETLVNSNMDSLFGGRNYKYLELQNGDIDALLSSGGRVLTFDFSTGKNPSVEVNGSIYNLMRSNGNGSFTPLPADRLFIHRDELWAPENIVTQTNADVVNKTGMTTGTPRHTYAALFIAAVGMDTNTLSYIYSTPALIHVFALPAQWTQ